MARITSYSLDQTLTSGDKVVGTDATTGTVRNYTVGELSTFINTASLGNYSFDTTQTPGAGTDNFVLTYDNSTGQISLEVAASQAAFNIIEDLTPQLGGTLDANSQIIDMGANTITDTKVGQWDTAYGWGDHSTQGYITSETSHADVVVDGDFTSQGIMLRGASSGTYSILTDNSTNWNTAYSWGDHSTQGYVTTSGVTGVTGTAPVVSSGGTTPAISMAAATTSVDGYLSSTNWNTFNNKLSSVGGDAAPVLGGNLDVNNNSIVSTGGLDIRITPDTSGNVVLDGIKYPQADGTIDQVLKTDGAGQLSFATVGGGSGDVVGPSSATDNAIARFDTTTGKLLQNSSATMDDTGAITAPDFIGDLNGAVRFDAKAIGSAILAGEVVYISGISGNTPEIQLAQSNSSSTMPAFGIALEDIIQDDTGEVATFGSVKGLDVTDFGETSITFSLGDTVYVSALEAGKLTNVPPSGEASLIQNIGKIERATPTSNMTIKVGGAGRTNATPNLDSAKMFLGNSSNQSVSVAMSGDVTIDNTGTTTVGTINSVAVATVTSGAALGATSNQDSNATILSGDLTGTVNSVAVATVTSGAALGATANQDSTATILAGNLTGQVNSVAVTTVAAGAALGATSTQPSDNVSTLTNDADYLPSDPTGVTGADVITNIMSLTQAEYDAIATPDASTLYIIA